MAALASPRGAFGAAALASPRRTDRATPSEATGVATATTAADGSAVPSVGGGSPSDTSARAPSAAAAEAVANGDEVDATAPTEPSSARGSARLITPRFSFPYRHRRGGEVLLKSDAGPYSPPPLPVAGGLFDKQPSARGGVACSRGGGSSRGSSGKATPRATTADEATSAAAPAQISV